MVCQLGNFLFCCHPVAVWHHLGLVFLGNCGLLSSEKKVEGYLWNLKGMSHRTTHFQFPCIESRACEKSSFFFLGWRWDEVRCALPLLLAASCPRYMQVVAVCVCISRVAPSVWAKWLDRNPVTWFITSAFHHCKFVVGALGLLHLRVFFLFPPWLFDLQVLNAVTFRSITRVTMSAGGSSGRARPMASLNCLLERIKNDVLHRRQRCIWPHCHHDWPYLYSRWQHLLAVSCICMVLLSPDHQSTTKHTCTVAL